VRSLGILVSNLTENSEEQFTLYAHALKRLSEGYEKRIRPHPLSVRIYQELCEMADAREDPYDEIKAASNLAAKRALPAVESIVNQHQGYERLRAAVMASIVGNLIDFNTAAHEPELDRLEEDFVTLLGEGFHPDNSRDLCDRIVSGTGSAVYLADNAGETLLDIPLLRFLVSNDWRVTYVVKGRAMVNDATRKDVVDTEIERLATIDDTGAWAHGVPLDLVSEEFMDTVRSADLVLSKGQANIETFPQIQDQIGVETYYITRAKCSHIAQAVGAQKSANVILRRAVRK
jgi:hypothetical protein